MVYIFLCVRKPSNKNMKKGPLIINKNIPKSAMGEILNYNSLVYHSTIQIKNRIKKFCPG